MNLPNVNLQANLSADVKPASGAFIPGSSTAGPDTVGPARCDERHIATDTTAGTRPHSPQI
ncbi:hypothetical protein GCM10023191_042280 [Actinoallomurus oryzae]|uniref:Uncharacterized protein n=1 Tax=Actinoallomurus oryzae TaxID=502180 RepID=A0ABP8Q5H8_9ACTN